MPNETDNTRGKFDDFAQIGVVVHDIARSIKYLSEIFGIGPFRVIDYPPAGRDDIERYYHGKPADFTARLAFANLGAIELELIQPLKGKSIWRDFLDEHGEGIHHIRFNVPDIERTTAYLKGHDIGVFQMGTGLRPGTMFKYFETESQVGFIIEAMNKLPGTDGKSPVSEDGTITV